MAEIETARLQFRQFTFGDLDAVASIRSDPEVMRYLGTGEPDSRDKARAWIETILARWKERGFGRWALIHKPDGKLIGWCGFALLENSTDVEVGYAIARPYWGKGLSTEAAAAAIGYSFEELGLARIAAVASPENIGSRRVMEKVGMTYVKITQHHGAEVVYYEISQEEYQRRRAAGARH